MYGGSFFIHKHDFVPDMFSEFSMFLFMPIIIQYSLFT